MSDRFVVVRKRREAGIAKPPSSVVQQIEVLLQECNGGKTKCHCGKGMEF
jgi:hypothetical protein